MLLLTRRLITADLFQAHCSYYCRAKAGTVICYIHMVLGVLRCSSASIWIIRRTRAKPWNPLEIAFYHTCCAQHPFMHSLLHNRNLWVAAAGRSFKSTIAAFRGTWANQKLLTYSQALIVAGIVAPSESADVV